MRDIQKLLRENVRSMQAYSSARDEFQGDGKIYLDANESPYSWQSSRYPDPKQIKLRSKIADWRNVNKDQVILGNGSDELIDLLIRAFCIPQKDRIRVLDPSYGMYNVSAALNDVQVIKTALTEDFQLPKNIEFGKNEKLFFLCSPNNPTGNCFSQKAIIEILEAFPGLVVIDEAYIDFSEQKSSVELISRFNNLVILQTMSKAYASAGLRVGIGLSNTEIIEILLKIKPPYNLSDLVQEKALERLNEEAIIQQQINDIRKERSRVKSQLKPCNYIEKIYPSDANFLLLKTKNADELYDFLLQRGIITRNRSKQYNCENCLRISIGTREENDQLIDAIKMISND